MVVFTVTSLVENPALNAAVKEHYPTNSLQVSPTLWLVAGSGTAQETSNRLGITTESGDGVVGNTIVVNTSGGYWGRAPVNIWEWIVSRREAVA